MTKPDTSTNIPGRDLHIWIDTYDDLFSDFDPRPFTERIISDDFLAEMNKLTEEKGQYIRTLSFLIPSIQRNSAQEEIIRKRLKNDFNGQHIHFSDIWTKNLRTGMAIVGLGVLSMSIVVALSQSDMNNLCRDIIKVILEPAGWFMMWTGLDKVAFGGREAKKKRDFYARLSQAEIQFENIT